MWVCIQRGLYRVPGGERLVKELRDRFLQGKTPLMLNKVQDIHVVCGLLKDFLRKLKEPLITFRLHRNFMEASGGTCMHSHTHTYVLVLIFFSSVLMVLHVDLMVLQN